MNRTIGYRFDDLHPCRTRDGDEIEAVFYGFATIAVTEDDWEIVEIDLDAGRFEADPTRRSGRKWVNRPVGIGRTNPLFGIVCDGLRRYYADKIADAISAAINDGRLSRRYWAEEHGTLNHAQQGV